MPGTRQVFNVCQTPSYKLVTPTDACLAFLWDLEIIKIEFQIPLLSAQLNFFLTYLDLQKNIEDHFSKNFNLLDFLKEKNKVLLFYHGLNIDAEATYKCVNSSQNTLQNILVFFVPP